MRIAWLGYGKEAVPSIIDCSSSEPGGKMEGAVMVCRAGLWQTAMRAESCLLMGAKATLSMRVPVLQARDSTNIERSP